MAIPFRPTSAPVGKTNPTTVASKFDEPTTPEELILMMSPDELEELLHNLGFEPKPETAKGIQALVAELGSLDAAIVAMTDSQVARRAA